MSKIAVALSGGVDSLYTLLTLHDAGHKVMGIHGLFLPQAINEKALNNLQAICDARHIPLHIIDFRQDFDTQVITPFIKAYAQGLTPNPCALCNSQIKFGLLMDKALELGAKQVATGHYATLKPSSYEEQKLSLCTGRDESKEQSYFLALVPRQRLEKALFPLANTHKKDNIQYLAEQGINIPIAKESQEICFVPADAYRPFMQSEAQKRHITLPSDGKVFVKEYDELICLGQHKGLWQYTEGQRRGLGIAWKEPLYVCEKNCENNTLILGNKQSLGLSSCVIHQCNYLVPQELWGAKLFAKVRYRQKPMPIDIENINDETGALKLNFHSPQSPTACGQVACIYDEWGCVLAGGIIKQTLFR